MSFHRSFNNHSESAHQEARIVRQPRTAASDKNRIRPTNSSLTTSAIDCSTIARSTVFSVPFVHTNVPISSQCSSFFSLFLSPSLFPSFHLSFFTFFNNMSARISDQRVRKMTRYVVGIRLPHRHRVPINETIKSVT